MWIIALTFFTALLHARGSAKSPRNRSSPNSLGLSLLVKIREGDRGVVRIRGVDCPAPGVFRFRVSSVAGGLTALSNPVECQAYPDMERGVIRISVHRVVGSEIEHRVQVRAVVHHVAVNIRRRMPGIRGRVFDERRL